LIAYVFLASGLPTNAIATTAVGHTKGSFVVSSSGAATYSIPIWTPSGIAGMQPSLALVYSSQSGNGLLGVGWSVAGLSNISRCNFTYAQDSLAGPAQFSPSVSDRFCIDGNRLRSFGTGAYGSDGSTYQTENADFSLIILHANVGATGPGWFEVHG